MYRASPGWSAPGRATRAGCNWTWTRTRPILMTAGSTIAGMIPIALEWAVGIERLSPLAVVAIGGLLAGTFLTLLVVPVLFHALEGLRRPRSSSSPAEITA